MSAPTPVKVPALGQVWPGQGGLFAGILRGAAGEPDQFLILAESLPDKRLAWNAACAWAETLEIDGHKDFQVPDRLESRMLWATLADHFDPSWYWTREQYSRDLAWFQYFGVGFQDGSGKSYEGRARAVRRFNVQSLSHSEGAAA